MGFQAADVGGAAARVDGKGTRDIDTAPTGLLRLPGALTDATKGLGVPLRAPAKLGIAAVMQRRRRAVARSLRPRLGPWGR